MTDLDTYYAIVDRTGRLVRPKPGMKNPTLRIYQAAEMLRPGTFHGKGESPELAEWSAADAAKKAGVKA
jgi:hypothetical protein